MKTTPIAAAIALATPLAAHADPATYDEYLEPILDCTTATLTYITIHWEAAETPEGYGEWVEVGRDSVVAQATGTDEGECPEWQLDDEGSSWVYTPHAETAPTVESADQATDEADGPQLDEGKLHPRLTRLFLIPRLTR